MSEIRLIDANALFEVASRHHDFFRNATSPTDKARRDEYLQVMCDINDAPTVEAVPVWWLLEKIMIMFGHSALGNLVVSGLMEAWQKEHGCFCKEDR